MGTKISKSKNGPSDRSGADISQPLRIQQDYQRRKSMIIHDEGNASGSDIGETQSMQSRPAVTSIICDINLTSKHRANLRRLWEQIFNNMSDFSMKLHSRMTYEFPQFREIFQKQMKDNMTAIALEARLQAHANEVIIVHNKIVRLLDDAEAVSDSIKKIFNIHGNYNLLVDTYEEQHRFLEASIKKEYSIDNDTKEALHLYFVAVNKKLKEVWTSHRHSTDSQVKAALNFKPPEEAEKKIVSYQNVRRVSIAPYDSEGRTKIVPEQKARRESIMKRASYGRLSNINDDNVKSDKGEEGKVELQDWQKRLLALHEQTIERERQKSKMGMKNTKLKKIHATNEVDEYTGLNKHEKEILRLEWNTFKANLAKHVVVLNFRLSGEIPNFKNFFDSKQSTQSSLLSIDVRLQTHTNTAMNSCGLILNALINKPELLPLYFEYLGLVHRKLGLSEEDILGFKNAMMNYLRSECRERMSPFVDHVWSAFLNAIVVNMHTEVQKYVSKHEIADEDQSSLIAKKKFWQAQERSASIIASTNKLTLPSFSSSAGLEEIASENAKRTSSTAIAAEDSKSEVRKSSRSFQTSLRPSDNFGPRQDALRAALFEQEKQSIKCCSLCNNPKVNSYVKNDE